MVRRRFCLFLAMLLLLPVIAGYKSNEDDDDGNGRGDDGNDDNDDEEEYDDEVEVTRTSSPITRTVPRRPLQCYVCAYKPDAQLNSCLDPVKYGVNTKICESAEDKCYTTVVSKDDAFETVVRGCHSRCVHTSNTSCCELNRCNSQPMAVPTPPPLPQALKLVRNKASQASPSVLFFVTILLVLQTVVKVAIV